MDFADTRGSKKSYNDGKRNNLKEIRERQYRKDQRVAQSQNDDADDYVEDDSTKFLKRMKEKEEKKAKAAEKALIYEQEMGKCIPKPKGKVI